MTIENLPISTFERIISNFLPQMKADMCYSACILNIVNELGSRKKISNMKYSLKEMNRLCGYKVGFQCKEAIVPNVLSEELEKFEYRYMRSFGNENDLVKLGEIITDDNLSYPIVSVSSRYFDEIGFKNAGYNKLNHSLVILGINHDIIYYYDPYEKFLEKSSYHSFKPRTIDKIIFEGVWEEAQYSKCSEWIEPLNYTQERLYSERFITNNTNEGVAR
jgi:hypothetical protein